MFQFTPSAQRLFWYAVVTLSGAALISFGQGRLLSWVPPGLFRPLGVILAIDLSVAILSCLFYEGSLARWQKVVAVSFLIMAVVLGFAGGMFQNVMQPLLIWSVCRWVVKGKAPIGALAFITVAFFILQPVKGTYRSLVFNSGTSFSTSQKLSIYGTLIAQHWLGRDAEVQSVQLDTRQSARNRLSLLLGTAHYVEWTPYPLDYRNGSTLGYLAYGWIPRAVWPDKPIAQQANKVLPVAYNLQSVTNQNTTMFGVGHLAEAYVNFGLVGILPVFLVFGALYRVPQLLLERRRTVATIAIFVSAAVAMAGIGSSISEAFGGFLQQILLQGFLLRIFSMERTPRRQAARRHSVNLILGQNPAPTASERSRQAGIDLVKN
jgi:hypothetical protein